MLKVCSVVLLAILSFSCTRTYITSTSPSTTQVNTPDPIKSDTVAFRVIGNANSARIRYSNSLDGLSQITTTLPFQETVVFRSDGSFLSLEATAISYNASVTNPFMSVQILVNGILFREASTSSFFLETISTSGTYRR